MSKAKEFIDKIKNDETFRSKINECRTLAEQAGLSIRECAKQLALIASDEGIDTNQEEIAQMLAKACKLPDADSTLVVGGFTYAPDSCGM